MLGAELVDQSAQTYQFARDKITLRLINAGDGLTHAEIIYIGNDYQTCSSDGGGYEGFYDPPGGGGAVENRVMVNELHSQAHVRMGQGFAALSLQCDSFLLARAHAPLGC